jgi:hypothetical protein
MTTTVCPIFSVCSAVAKIDQEIENLIVEFKSKVKGFKGESSINKISIPNENDPGWDPRLGDMKYRYGTCYFGLKIQSGRGKGRKVGLSLHFDLARDISGSIEWEHAGESLLVVSYAATSNEEEWWGALPVSSSGCFEDADESSWDLRGFLDNKLLIWQWNKDSLSPDIDIDWSRQDWAFGLPLRTLENTQTVEQQLVMPIMKLLSGSCKESDLKRQLNGWNAIAWQLEGCDRRSISR